MKHFHSPAFKRFLRYAGVGGSTFAFDLTLLWLVTEFLTIPYQVSTAGAFLVAISINYFVSRRYVFKGTSRRVHHGYLYFILVAFGGAAVVTGAVAFLVSFLGLHYLVARTIVACFVGIGNYLFNLHLNFRVAGHHP